MRRAMHPAIITLFVVGWLVVIRLHEAHFQPESERLQSQSTVRHPGQPQPLLTDTTFLYTLSSETPPNLILGMHTSCVSPV